MKNLRIWFKKINTAKFISHLDMCRLMERAIHKAKLPFWYTQGFNPHVFLTINMPISLGYTGLRECMDVKLLDDDMEFETIKDGLNSGLPMDVRIFDITEVVLKPGDVAFSSYEIRTDVKENLLETAQNLLSQDEILVEKKTKKGFKEVDIKPDFKSMTVKEEDNEIIFEVVLSSSNQGSINPRLFFDVLCEKFGEKIYFQTARINSFDKDMKEFR